MTGMCGCLTKTGLHALTPLNSRDASELYCLPSRVCLTYQTALPIGTSCFLTARPDLFLQMPSWCCVKRVSNQCSSDNNSLLLFPQTTHTEGSQGQIQPALTFWRHQFHRTLVFCYPELPLHAFVSLSIVSSLKRCRCDDSSCFKTGKRFLWPDLNRRLKTACPGRRTLHV